MHAAYKYEYYDDQAVLSPRPKSFHAMLNLTDRPQAPLGSSANGKTSLRRLVSSDWDDLPSLFADAFWRVPPFAVMNEEKRYEAAQQCLERTRTGGDGPLVEESSFIASHEHFGSPCAAILITLMPDRDLATDWRAFEWVQPPGADVVERRLGRPHLTWIFVHPWLAYHGVGSQLLVSAANALTSLGYRELASTFLLGNDSTLLWHWRNGFRVLAGIGSYRRPFGDSSN
jgi:hypothetical protein